MRLQAIMLAFAMSVFIAGCATFSLGGQDTLIAENDGSIEANFRDAATEFQEKFSEAGWLREEESNGRVKAMVSLLSKGWSRINSDALTKDNKPNDAIAQYLGRIAALSGDQPSAQIIDIDRDIAIAHTAMVKLNVLAALVVEQAATQPAGSIRTDLAVLERALLAASKAQSLFEDAIERLAPQLDAITVTQSTTQLAENAKEIDHMKTLASTLSGIHQRENLVG